MNSVENPELSHLCDVTAEYDRLVQVNAELVAALKAWMKAANGDGIDVHNLVRLCAKSEAAIDAALEGK